MTHTLSRAICSSLLTLLFFCGYSQTGISAGLIFVGSTSPSCGSVFAYAFTIDHTKCGGSNSTGFSKLYSWTNADLKDIAHGGKVVNTGGNYYDIEFASSATSISNVATHLYSWKIVNYDPVNGVLQAFINLTTSHTVDVVGYLVIGNSCINSFQGGTTAFDASTVAVYPMTNGVTLSAIDISNNANNGVITGCTASATAQIPSGSAAFSGSSQYINIGTASSIEITGQITIEALVNPTNYSNYNGICSKTNGNIPASWDCYLNQGDGKPQFFRGASSFPSLYAVGATSAVSTNTWSYIAFTDQATTLSTGMSIYVNGSSLTTTPAFTGPGSLGDAGNDGKIGTRDDGVTMFTGLMQYVIIASTSRNADWETTRYNDFMGTLTTYGSGTQIF